MLRDQRIHPVVPYTSSRRLRVGSDEGWDSRLVSLFFLCDLRALLFQFFLTEGHKGYEGLDHVAGHSMRGSRMR